MQGIQTILFALWCLAIPVSAQTQIFWFSEQNATNLAADGTTAMDGSFRFELGVFTSSFVPEAGNISEWSANWNPAQRASYQADLKRFTTSFIAESTAAPFTPGKSVYIWGFKGDPAAGEWILFRAPSWVWPAATTGPPPFVTWDAKDATAIIGTIHSTGSPFLMKVAAVSNVLPPITTYAQWQTDELSGEALNLAHQDADGDGTVNIFEFIFGTSPIKANPSPLASASLVTASSARYLQLTIPRRADRPADLVVEVSGNLSTWSSGASHTGIVSSSATSLVVRDLIPVNPTAPKRFIRIRATP